ncbi:methyltransferase [Streptomyces sp. NRRL B-1347]|uniref:methyltransferase n=1 Tax=Streptomyces sp. NRRL B-1347 TaxID=1476877 RepID=UPI0004C5578D|nr:methyltransferase [Streptomyces sp. NRRL B-1347]
MAHTSPPPLTMMADLITPWALRVAATLRLADLTAHKPLGARELAERCGADAEALERLLRYLAVRGVFEETADGYMVTELGEPLREDVPGSRRLWWDLGGAGGRMDLAFGSMLHTVRTGRPAYAEVHGKPFWQDLADDPELARSFDALMSWHDAWFEDIAQGYDWSAAERVTDVGGGAGALLARLMSDLPKLHGTLVELPATLEAAEELLSAAGVRDRCHLVRGDFFDALPTGSDVYVLSNVLHDWNDADALRVLRRCAEAAAATGPDSRVLIADRLTDQDGDPRLVTMLDLRMLVTVGGRERTLTQLTRLAEAAGLRVVSVCRRPGTGMALLECAAGGE